VLNGDKNHYLVGAKREIDGNFSTLKWIANKLGFTLWNGSIM
jgi:hypothetical protein